MATVVNKTTLRILRSVHTPDYPKAQWLHNPSFPNCASIYWKVLPNDRIWEMTADEKVVKDAEIRAQEVAQQIEDLIFEKQVAVSREDAIQALKDDGVLDANGDLIGG